jgi:hypothetical protein
MRWVLSSLLTVGLCASLGPSRLANADDARKAGAKDAPPATQPAPKLDDGAVGTPAVRPYGAGRPRTLDGGRAREGFGRPADRPGPGPRPLGAGKRGTDDDSDSPAAEQVAKVMDFARENFPPLYDRLARLRDSNPVVFRQMVKRVRGPIMEILKVRQRDPEVAHKLIELQQVEMDLRDLRAQYQAARSDDQRQQLKAQIRELVDKRYDLRLERLRLEVRDLEKRLDQAKTEVAKREKDKNTHVDREMRQLLGTGSIEPQPPGPGAGAGLRPGKRAQPPPPPPVVGE